MARFYQTASPQYLDYIYQPPWELINQVMATKQNEYDTALATESILNNMLEFNYKRSDANDENVQNIKSYWETNINDTINQIRKDPSNAASYMPKIQQLSKELMADRKTGNISKLEGEYNTYQQWLKDTEDIKKSDPARFNAAHNYYNRQWIEGGANALNQGWRGDLVTKDVDWQKLYDTVEKLKANEWTNQSEAPDGKGYIWKNKNTGEVVTADRIETYLMSRLLNPEDLASMRQTQQFGQSRYFNDEGQLDYNAPGFLGLRGVSASSAHQNIGNEQSVSGDSTWGTIYSQNAQDRRQARGFEHDKAMKWMDFEINSKKDADNFNRQYSKELEQIIMNPNDYDPSFVEAAKQKYSYINNIPYMDKVNGKDVTDVTTLFGGTETNQLLAQQIYKNIDVKDFDLPAGVDKFWFKPLYDQLVRGDINQATFEQAAEIKYLREINPDLFVKEYINKRGSGMVSKTNTPNRYAQLEADARAMLERATKGNKQALKDVENYFGTKDRIGVDKFIQTLNSKVGDYNIPIPVHFQPLDVITGDNISSIIKNNSQSFTITNVSNYAQHDGSIDGLKINMAGSMGETSNSLRGTIDGKEVIITAHDRTTPAAVAVKNLASRDIPETSPLYQTYVNEDVGIIERTFNTLLSQTNGNFNNIAAIKDPTGNTEFKIKAKVDPGTGNRSYNIFIPTSDGNNPFDFIGTADNDIQLAKWLRENQIKN